MKFKGQQQAKEIVLNSNSILSALSLNIKDSNLIDKVNIISKLTYNFFYFYQHVAYKQIGLE